MTERPPPRTVTVSPQDLPLSCPMPDADKWNAHPRVFLPLSERTRQRDCPYCGTRYILAGGDE